jgi:hypothetical protein
VNVDHAHDLEIRSSITVVLLMFNNTPIRCLSKRQKNLETSTYGSEIEASRFDTALILEVRFMLRSLYRH